METNVRISSASRQLMRCVRQFYLGESPISQAGKPKRYLKREGKRLVENRRPESPNGSHCEISILISMTTAALLRWESLYLHSTSSLSRELWVLITITGNPVH